MLYVILFGIILLIVLNFTFVFHPKIRLDSSKRVYTHMKDRWFTKEGNKKLLICIHGIYSTPKTFEGLAAYLLNQGWDVYAPALPASSLSRDEVRELGAWAWDESLIVIRDKLSHIPSHYQTVSLCGHSQGGSLSMQIASEGIIDIQSLIVIASPIFLYGNHLKLWENIAVFIAGILSFIFPNGVFLPIKNVEEMRNYETHCDAEGIQMPFMIYTFKRGLSILRKNLYKIKVPLLLMYCVEDKLVGFDNMWQIQKRVGSDIIEEKIYTIPDSVEPYTFKHQLLNHNSVKEDVIKTVYQFLNRVR